MKKLAAWLLTAALILVGCANIAPTSGGSGPSSESASAVGVAQAASSADYDSSSQPERASALPLAETESKAPQSAAAAVSTQPVQTQPLTWWQAGLAEEKVHIINSDDYFELPHDKTRTYFYFYDDAQKASYDANGCFSKLGEDVKGRDYDLALLLDSARESNNIGERILPDNYFELVVLDDTKYTGAFFEKGIKLTRSLPGEGQGNSVLLSLDETDYATLKANMAERTGDDNYRSVAWLSMMRRSRMVSATITSSDGKAVNTLDFTTTLTDDDYFNAYFYDEVNPIVSSGGQGVAEKSLPGAAKVEIIFNNGLEFQVYYTSEYLLITASDVQGSLLYKLKSEYTLNTITDFAYKVANPTTGKPVIYLYPTQKTDCTVKVGYPQFTYTFPQYDNGWRVTAYPDGRLVNKADGTEHYYLFWEGRERVNWDFSSGFVVKGADTEAFLREKLAFLGLTPREYNDFITYWVPQMKYAPYHLITFAGDQYEALAPLTVTPKPDSVLRVHMVFKTIDAPVQIPEQTLTPFERKGFTVVEWGATNAS
ncbi:MAG TPA: hypothetical protein VN626_03480 [Clostridia bacterium]|nr:hypothetical protein [Clostridia bacterium]